MFYTFVPTPPAPAPQARVVSSLRNSLFIFLTVVLLSSTLGCAGHSVAESTDHFPTARGFRQHEFHLDGKVHSLCIFIPKDYTPASRYPAILFLHGIFEAGGNSDKCLSGGLAPVIARDPDNWPFITIFPQSDNDWKGDSHDRLAMASLDFAQQVWSIDPDRVTLAGLSVGGLGTWEIGARHHERFAALVPMSGISATEVVARIFTLPVWAFVYRDDPFVSAANSAQMCQQIRNLGGQPRLTQFPGMGHDCWPQAVAQSDLVKWMLTQHRQPSREIPIVAMRS